MCNCNFFALKSLAVTGLIASISAFLPPLSHAGDKVAVELFTSQGCSSCPPADAILRYLSHNENIVALSYNVTYWDYIGWPDKFAHPDNDARQRNYARKLGRASIYTPQMIFDGMVDIVGSRRLEIERVIRSRLSVANKISVSVERKGKEITVKLAPEDQDIPDSAYLWLIGYANPPAVDIESGENTGKTIRYANVVKYIHDLGEWRGIAALSVELARKNEAEAIAVLVHDGRFGPIVGSASLKLSDQ